MPAICHDVPCTRVVNTAQGMSLCALVTAGSIQLKAVMNMTYTYDAYYAADIPRSPGGPLVAINAIRIAEPYTVAVSGDRAVALNASLPLVCDSTNSSVNTFDSADDPAEFPVRDPTRAVYRPGDSCSWDLTHDGAHGLRASTNVMWMSRQAVLTFMASRQVSEGSVSRSERLMLTNKGDGRGTGLQVNGDSMSVWLDAHSTAGYSFYIEYRSTSNRGGFSWSITVRSHFSHVQQSLPCLPPNRSCPQCTCVQNVFIVRVCGYRCSAGHNCVHLSPRVFTYNTCLHESPLCCNPCK